MTHPRDLSNRSSEELIADALEEIVAILQELTSVRRTQRLQNRIDEIWRRANP